MTPAPPPRKNRIECHFQVGTLSHSPPQTGTPRHAVHPALGEDGHRRAAVLTRSRLGRGEVPGPSPSPERPQGPCLPSGCVQRGGLELGAGQEASCEVVRMAKNPGKTDKTKRKPAAPAPPVGTMPRSHSDLTA